MRVAPFGELDIATVDKLQAEVSQLLETGFAKIVLDLRGVRFLDSTGLRLVLELDAAARSRFARPARAAAAMASSSSSGSPVSGASNG